MKKLKKFKKNEMYQYKYSSKNKEFTMLMVSEDGGKLFVIVRASEYTKGFDEMYVAGEEFIYNSEEGEMVGPNKEDYIYVSATSTKYSHYTHYITHIGHKEDFPEYFL